MKQGNSIDRKQWNAITNDVCGSFSEGAACVLDDMVRHCVVVEKMHVAVCRFSYCIFVSFAAAGRFSYMQRLAAFHTCSGWLLFIHAADDHFSYTQRLAAFHKCGREDRGVQQGQDVAKLRTRPHNKDRVLSYIFVSFAADGRFS